MNLKYSPQFPMSAVKAPVGSDGLCEKAYDGYRMGAIVASGDTQLINKNGKDWTARFREIAAHVGRIFPEKTIIDGQVVAELRFNESPSSELITEAAVDNPLTPLELQSHYYIFDILMLAGEDLRRYPLKRRRGMLRKLCAQFDTAVHLSMQINDKKIVEQCGEDLAERPHVIYKRLSSSYSPGKSPHWLSVRL